MIKLDMSAGDSKEPQWRTPSISKKKETPEEAKRTPASLPLSLASPSTLNKQLSSFTGETKNKTLPLMLTEAERKERAQLVIIWTSRIGKSSLHSETRASLAIKAHTMERVRCKVTKQ
jgi:hypothetical protein